MKIAIILSGGIGSRMGANIPKQYIEVQGKPIIWYCLRTFIKCSQIDVVIIGRAIEWNDYIVKQLVSLESRVPIYFAEPGETRQYSIYNALLEAQKHGAKQNDIVIIHDAARPLVSEELILRCLDGCDDAEGVLPIIPVKDTLYQSLDGKHISNLLNRSELYAGQAPEAFKFGKYLNLHEQLSREELLTINGSTEIAYKGGLKIKLIKGEEINFKITTHEDLSNFESIIKQRTI